MPRRPAATPCSLSVKRMRGASSVRRAASWRKRRKPTARKNRSSRRASLSLAGLFALADKGRELCQLYASAKRKQRLFTFGGNVMLVQSIEYTVAGGAVHGLTAGD